MSFIKYTFYPSVTHLNLYSLVFFLFLIISQFLGNSESSKTRLDEQAEIVRSKSCSVVSDSLSDYGLYSSWNSPGQNTGVGSLSLLQGIFPTQGSNPGLPHCRRILCQLSHKESPRILEWVVDSFSSRSSQPRNWIEVSCIVGGFFTNWAIREALTEIVSYVNL